MPRRGSEQAFSRDAQARISFQTRARKLLAEVEKLNKHERQLRQKGVDLRITTVLSHIADINRRHHPPQRVSSNQTPRGPTQSAAALLEAKAAAASMLSQAPAPATWYSDLVTPTPAPKRRAPMRPPSPRPLRSLRNSRRQSESANTNSADVPAVAKHAHVATDEAPVFGRNLRTRAQRRAAMKLSPSDPASSHDTASVALGPATPSQCPEERRPYSLRQRAVQTEMPLVDTDMEVWADEENGPSHANAGLTVDEPSQGDVDATIDAECSPHITCFPAHNARTTPWSSPTMTPVQHQVDMHTGSHTKRSPLQDATWSALQDPMMSPAMRAVCSGLDLSRLDDSAVALSPIASGLSPLALGLADLPSPLTALPALMSPLPDTLQSPTVLPCMPLPSGSAKDLDVAQEMLDANLLGVLSSCKSTNETLSSSLRHAARNPALTPRLLPAYRDWRMINMRDLGTFASPRGTRIQEPTNQSV
eukprot:jgi/Ulvmu1/9148/UM005_0246.1